MQIGNISGDCDDGVMVHLMVAVCHVLSSQLSHVYCRPARASNFNQQLCVMSCQCNCHMYICRPARASNFNQALGERAPEPDCVLPITSFPPAVPLSPPVQMSPQMTWQTAHAHRRSHRASANAAVLPAQAPISGSVNGFVKKTPPLPLGTPAGLVGPCSSFAMLRQAQADARRDDRYDDITYFVSGGLNPWIFKSDRCCTACL